MDRDARRIRAAIAALGEREPNQPYPAHIRAEVVAYAGRRRKRGRAWRSLGQAVGLDGGTVRRGLEAAEAAGTATGSCEAALRAKVEAEAEPVALVPVEVEAAPPAEQGGADLVLVSPAGFRLLGLDLVQAAELLRTLS